MKRSFFLILSGIVLFSSSCSKCDGREMDTYLPAERKLILQTPIDSIVYFQSSTSMSIDTFQLQHFSHKRHESNWDQSGDGGTDFNCTDTYEGLGYSIKRLSDDFALLVSFRSHCKEGRTNCLKGNFIQSPYNNVFTPEPDVTIGSITYTHVISVVVANSVVQKIYYDFAEGFIQYETNDGELFQKMN